MPGFTTLGAVATFFVTFTRCRKIVYGLSIVQNEMFVDNVELSLLSGAGGSGSISFKSKGTKSSPNGGSGGDGGSIYFKTDKKIYDFSSIYSNSSFKAENGEDAGKDFQDGKSGKDLLSLIHI